MRLSFDKYRIKLLLSLLFLGTNLTPVNATSRYLEDLSPNLSRQFALSETLHYVRLRQREQVGKPAHATGSPTRREALISPPSLQGKEAGGLGLTLAFPHEVKSQVNANIPVKPKLAQYNLPTATTLLNQGLQAIQAGRTQDAIAAFQQASQLDPTLAPAHYNLGLALRQSGKLQPAADAFYRATQSDPKFALAYANLGGALLEGNNLPQANDYLQRALELDPKLGFAHYNLGLVRQLQRNWDGAIASFKKASEYSKNAPEPHYHLGICYLQQGKLKEARNAFNQAVKINPRYPEAYYNLGVIAFNQGNSQAALAEFRKSAEANPNYPNAYYGAGLAFMQLKQYSEAAKVLNHARNLYNAQRNPQWAKNAEQLLQQVQKFNSQQRGGKNN